MKVFRSSISGVSSNDLNYRPLLLLLSMAKIRHNQFIDTLTELSKNAKAEGVIQLYTEDESFSGRVITIKGKELLHFGTTGYLGLEQDIRIKKAAAEAIMKYGTQFPLSKTYLSHSLYKQLEEKLFEMYGCEVLVTKNSTLGHIGVLPSIIRDEDGIIMDHQVHWSVQNAVQSIKSRGVPVEMIRHNDMDMLESRIKMLSQNCEKIWYLADGVYSMFGDVAPINQIKELCLRYPQLYLYYDDVHGMSWKGKHGTGFVIDQYGRLPENVVVFTTMSKSFGASGSTMVTTNRELLERVKSFGGPLTFSAQLEPASVAAAIASCDIHLSPEIVRMQQSLMQRIDHCNQLLLNTDLPLVEVNDCPVFYVGTGVPAVGYNFTKKLYHEGIYANMGLFPAVPVKRTGIRFTISLHNRLSDIDQLIAAMEYHYPASLKEEGYTNNQVRKIFKLPALEVDSAQPKAIEGIRTETYDSIDQIAPEDWNPLMTGRNCFDHEGLQILENVFSKSTSLETNWDFRYLIIRDQSGKIILATFFTRALWKDDMLAPESVSRHLESLRESAPYLHTSNVLTMGSLFTEGEHLYWDETSALANHAIEALFQHIEELDAALKPDVIALRDFENHEKSFKSKFDSKGYVRISLPDTNYFDVDKLRNVGEFVDVLTSRSRKHFKKDIQPFIGRLELEVRSSLSTEEIDRAYTLYQNVWKNNLAMNTFSYQRELFTAMAEENNWEFILLRCPKRRLIVGVMFAYTNGTTYCPSLVGIDYGYTIEFSVYRQLLYQAIKRGSKPGLKRIDFGFSANFEKHKLGAESLRRYAYLQAKDNYSLEMLETLS